MKPIVMAVQRDDNAIGSSHANQRGMLSTARVDSPLGCWTLTEWTPMSGERLADSIVKIWLFEGVTALARERLFPDGTLEIVLQLDASYRRADVPAEPFAPLSIGGLRTTALTIEGPGRPVRVLGVRLRPAGGFALLHTALAPLTDGDYDLHDVIGTAAAELGEVCHGARHAPACVLAALTWAARRIERGARPDNLVAEVAGQIEAGGGSVVLGELAAAARYSRSRFASRFRDQIGVAPKHFARLVRFRRALDFITAGRSALGDVAACAGYYDQAHMNADFKALAGLTPGGFRDALRYPNSASLAEPGEPTAGPNFQDAATAEA